MKRPRRNIGATVWIADGGYPEPIFSNREAAALWLKDQHARQCLDAARMNRYEVENRAERLADLDAGLWTPTDPEGMREHLTDHTTKTQWEVSEIRWEGTVARFTYMHDEFRIREVGVVTDWPKKDDTDD